jgi:hypothetical protein
VYAWLVAAALAAPPTAYPYQADVDLPAKGIVLIDIPLELRAPENVRDGSDLLLVDANGREVPFAVIDGRPQRTDVSGRRIVGSSGAPLGWQPDPAGTGELYDVWIAQQPLDGLSIGLRDVPAYADITVSRVQDDGRLQEVARKRVFRILRRDDNQVPGPFPPGHYKLEVRHIRAPTHIDGYRLSQPALPDAEVELALGPPVVQENGVTLYDITLPRPLAATHLTLLPEEDLFERDVRIHTDVTRDELPGTLAPTLDAVPRDKVIGRVRIGDTSLSDTTIPLPTYEAVRQYHVAVQGEPLTIPTAMLSAEGFAIVARDPGPGPHRLYGGAVHGRPSRDMAAGLDALVRSLDGRVGTGAVVENLTFEAPPIPGSALGPTLDTDGLAWARPLSVGDVHGVARIPLDDHVLVNGRADLADLRLRTADGRQVPYALRRHPDTGYASDLPFTRGEKGKESVLEVALPEKNLPVRTLTLHTQPGMHFDRVVTLWRQRGKRREVLRHLQWNSDLNPETLSIAVGQRVGEELVVTIDNGDDPPLAVDTVDLQWDRWELVAYLPDQPVFLLYGDEGRWHPSYDAAPVLRRVAEAPAVELGEPTRLEREAPAVERAATIVGLGCVGAGFVGMLVMLVTMAPRDEEEAEEGEAPEEPDPVPPDPAQEPAEAPPEPGEAPPTS